MKLERNKFLVVAAHPDDELIGCGGSLIKLKKKNIINTIFLSDGESSRKTNKVQNKIIKRRNDCLKAFKYLKLNEPEFYNFPDNKMDTVPFLDIVKIIESKIMKFKPDTIITHFENCLNIDHRITFKAVVTACRPLKNVSVRNILSFEVPSSTDWALLSKKSFNPNFYVDITGQINKKIASLKFYNSEMKKFPHSRSKKNIKALAQIRGAASGVRFAEAFYLSRCVIK